MGNMAWMPGLGASSPYAAGVTDFTPDKLEQVLKSITTGVPTGNTTAGGANAGGLVQMESVESTMANISYDPQKHFRFMGWMRRNNLYVQANALLHQFARIKKTFNPLVSVATGNTKPGLDRSAQIERLSTQLRLFNAKGSYEFFQDMLGNKMLQLPGMQGQTSAKTLSYVLAVTQLLGGVTRDMLYGDSDINANEPDGFFKQIRTKGIAGVNTIDLRGRAPTSEIVRKAIAQLYQNQLGIPTVGFGEPMTMESLASEMEVRSRLSTGDGKTVVMGNPVKAIEGALTGLELIGDLFFGASLFSWPTVADEADTGAPASATFSIQPAASGSGTSFSADDAGTYIYGAVPVNHQTGHPLGTVSDPVTVTEGQQVAFTLGDTANANAFYLYRSEKNGDSSTLKFWKRVKKGSGTTAVTDNNSVISGKGKMLLVRPDVFNLAFAHINGARAQAQGPGMELPGDVQAVLFGVQTFAQEFAVIMNGAPFMMAPEWAILFENVGEADSSIIL